MNTESIINKLESIDWSQYCGPEYYDPDTVTPALLSLLYLENPSEANDVGDKLLFSIGNNHAGTYYPAILSALEIIIEIEQESKESIRKTCAGAVLGDLSSFEPDPDLGNYSGTTLEELLKYAQNKLEPYSD
ncbi:hypothetical protein [Shewanella nanhaiensis]|uniref:DUF4375 domain-containing protein n=1 Tax=Shewanella nanhaiensis TaxID=2864872 RepID=A0ABS7DYY5_9GAMM|nr:hypothetical protein [Shewanella nanhaiensis]MBW8182161.1 hypothetical protein [Shewanella nanhaiensis]